MDILTILILPIHEHRVSFHFFALSPFSNTVVFWWHLSYKLLFADYLIAFTIKSNSRRKEKLENLVIGFNFFSWSVRGIGKELQMVEDEGAYITLGKTMWENLVLKLWRNRKLLRVERERNRIWLFLSSPPEDLPNPGIEPGSPALQADSLLSEPQGSPM